MRMMSFIFILPMIILMVLGAVIYGVWRSTRREEYDYNDKNPFKILFYILAGIIGVTGVLFIANFTTGSNFIRGHSFLSALPAMIIFPLFMLIPITIFIIIGRFVYYDAKGRGMDPWLWLLVVIFVPNFIGLIIYLIVRNSYNSRSKKCFNCGNYVREDYNICPNCGNNLKKTCSQCGRGVEKGWSMCPYCGNNLN